MNRGDELLSQMRHAVGRDGFRNYFATDDDDADWEFLVSMRLAVKGRLIPGGLRNYHVSTAGVAALRALYPRKYKRELKGVPAPEPEATEEK